MTEALEPEVSKIPASVQVAVFNRRTFPAPPGWANQAPSRVNASPCFQWNDSMRGALKTTCPEATSQTETFPSVAAAHHRPSSENTMLSTGRSRSKDFKKDQSLVRQRRTLPS